MYRKNTVDFIYVTLIEKAIWYVRIRAERNSLDKKGENAMYTFPDITNWQDDIFADYRGYTRKLGKISPDGAHYMVKFEKKHTFKSTPLNIIHQHINSEIIGILGFSAQKTFLATCFGHFVICCENFVPKNSKLVTFDVFLHTLYNSSELANITDLEKMQRIFDTNPILHPYKEELSESFWDMIVLDMFITNFDRTTSDFGYLISAHGVTPAPLFDNRTNYRNMYVPIIHNKERALYVDLLYTDKFKKFHTSVNRILPIIEKKMDSIHNFIYSQEYLSETHKSMTYDVLCESMHCLQLSYKLRQISAMLSVEAMNLIPNIYNTLQELQANKKTVDEVVAEVIKRYT